MHFCICKLPQGRGTLLRRHGICGSGTWKNSGIVVDRETEDHPLTTVDDDKRLRSIGQHQLI